MSAVVGFLTGYLFGLAVLALHHAREREKHGTGYQPTKEGAGVASPPDE